MKDGVQQTLGRTITGIVVAENRNTPLRQVFLAFSDDTYFEFYGDRFSGAGGLDPGGLAGALEYAGHFRPNTVLSYVAEDPATGRPVEPGFLRLAGEWEQAAILAGPDQILPSATDLPALACILLARERTAFLGQKARHAIEANYKLRAETRFRICDSFVWELCAACFKRVPANAYAFTSLANLMGHANSGLRRWGMEMGWLVRTLLPAGWTVDILLKDVADTLGSHELALGLAATFFDGEEAFFAAADAFKAPRGFTPQYRQRIRQAKKLGIATYQVHFLRLEGRVRQALEDHCLG